MFANHSTSHGRAFTIIELLVVIAVVGVLLVLTLPALRAAQASGRSSVCGSNIRQLANANTIYAVDFDENYVPAAADIFLGAGGRKRWHGQRKSPGVSPNPADNEFDPARGPLRGYMDTKGRVKHCPSFLDAIKDGARNAFEAGTGGYGYNQQYVGGRNDLYGFSPRAARTTAQTTDPASPSATVMFTDAAFAQTAAGPTYYLIEYSFCEPVFWQLFAGTPSSMRTDPSIHFRHEQTTNAAWVDGHVSTETMSRSGRSRISGIPEQVMRELGFGWFGPESNELFDLE